MVPVVQSRVLTAVRREEDEAPVPSNLVFIDLQAAKLSGKSQHTSQCLWGPLRRGDMPTTGTSAVSAHECKVNESPKLGAAPGAAVLAAARKSSSI